MGRWTSLLVMLNMNYDIGISTVHESKRTLKAAIDDTRPVIEENRFARLVCNENERLTCSTELPIYNGDLGRANE